MKRKIAWPQSHWTLAALLCLAVLGACSQPADNADGPSAEPAPDSSSTETAAPSDQAGEDPADADATAQPEAKAGSELTRVEAESGGALTLELPEGTTSAGRDVSDGGLVSQRFELPDNIRFQVNILGPVGLMPDFGSEEYLENQVKEWLRLRENGLVDGPREIVSMQTDSLEGYYVKVTSDEANPQALNFAINGCFRVGDHVVMMGGLHDDDSGAQDEIVLNAIQSAAWEDGGSEPASSTQ